MYILTGAVTYCRNFNESCESNEIVYLALSNKLKGITRFYLSFITFILVKSPKELKGMSPKYNLV